MAKARTSSKAKAPGTADVVAEAKAALQAAATRKAAAGEASTPKPEAKPEPEPLSAADRENPDKLSGEALRKLAHQRGIARSEAERMDDDKLRMQLRYIIHRQYAEAEE